MPIYEYVCPKCDIHFERTLPFSEAGAYVFCPDCKMQGQKVFSAPYIIWGQGYFKHMRSGKQDDIIVSYPDGHTKHKRHNELYADGGL